MTLTAKSNQVKRMVNGCIAPFNDVMHLSLPCVVFANSASVAVSLVDDDTNDIPSIASAGLLSALPVVMGLPSFAKHWIARAGSVFGKLFGLFLSKPIYWILVWMISSVLCIACLIAKDSFGFRWSSAVFFITVWAYYKHASGPLAAKLSKILTMCHFSTSYTAILLCCTAWKKDLATFKAWYFGMDPASKSKALTRTIDLTGSCRKLLVAYRTDFFRHLFLPVDALYAGKSGLSSVMV